MPASRNPPLHRLEKWARRVAGAWSSERGAASINSCMRRVLAVEDPQRIGVQPARASASSNRSCAEMRNQGGCGNARALPALADGVHVAARCRRGPAFARGAAHDELSTSTSGPENPALRRRRCGIRGNGPFAGARAGTAARCTTAAAGRRRAVVLDAPRARSARGRLRPQRRLSPFTASSNEYMSFSTMSVTSPTPRTNSSVASTIGMRMFP